MVPDPVAAAKSQPDSQPRGYELVDFRQLPAVSCPCGQARRAFADAGDFPGTIHVTEIQQDARLHYHKRLTEVYYFLECENDAKMQLGDQQLPVAPGQCVLIRPGTRHRAIGKMKVLIVVYPKFDATDEWFD
jgi:mannose-6-phosphate isomerase-like protein (cupin superfamily)